jgi:hypothetical protein
VKRFRVFANDFDSRSLILTQEIMEGWEPEVKRLWYQNRSKIYAGLAQEFGTSYFDKKVKDFIDLGDKPISLVTFHNKFFQQARKAFIFGSYYPALTGLCTLGERVLNHLILLFRDDFKHTSIYKSVYRKQSFDDWELAIRALEEWGILLPETTNDFHSLKQIRNRVIHFNPEVDENDRELALEANKIFIAIINNQFSAFVTRPWYIENTPGSTYVKKSYEDSPFVRKIVLPNCHLVGYKHFLEPQDGQFVIHDDFEYQNREISDEEFVTLLSETRSQNPK